MLELGMVVQLLKDLVCGPNRECGLLGLVHCSSDRKIKISNNISI